MAITSRWNLQWTSRLAFVLLIAACVTPLAVRSLLPETGPFIHVEAADGVVRMITLSEMKKMPVLTREGSYQNQYDNWQDQGAYSGVLLTDLIGNHAHVTMDVVAEDGYRVTIDRGRIEDSDYPMVLSFRMNGDEVPGWEDGFRIAVLPEDGGVSNADYGVESAGSYWVKRVSRLILKP